MTSGNKKCSRCNQTFNCGVAAGEATCWCFNEPQIMPYDPNAQCLCPACLKQAMDELLKRYPLKKEK